MFNCALNAVLMWLSSCKSQLHIDLASVQIIFDQFFLIYFRSSDTLKLQDVNIKCTILNIDSDFMSKLFFSQSNIYFYM